jgi:dihydroorotate dehydrogenase (NAD+) catalytic subunit
MKTIVDLTAKLGELVLQNPVVVASGTFGYGDEYQGLVNVNRLGAIATKAITLEPRAGNVPPRIVETPAGMLNAIGLANVGVDVFIAEKMPFLRSLKTKTIVNVAGSSEAEYVKVVEKLEPVEGIAALEINISCPNVKRGGMSFGSQPDTVYNIVNQLRQTTKRYLIVKLTPNVTDIVGIARRAEAAGADAISIINTVMGMAVDIRSRKPRLKNIFGGLSGPAIKPIALACVYRVTQAIGIPVIGGGGIMCAEDALEFIMAGARAVSIGTANFVNPKVAEEVIDGIRQFCREEKITTVEALVGTLKV